MTTDLGTPPGTLVLVLADGLSCDRDVSLREGCGVA
jgi:hypothetical protein